MLEDTLSLLPHAFTQRMPGYCYTRKLVRGMLDEV